MYNYDKVNVKLELAQILLSYVLFIIENMKLLIQSILKINYFKIVKV
jgi:hypothetical protein